jgi:ankyrin repeat protein
MKLHEVNVLTFDVNGDSPLDLACIRGFDAKEDEDFLDENFWPDKPEGERQHYTSKRFQVVKKLLTYIDHEGISIFTINEKTIRRGMNTPLHWAIYWTDIELAEVVFCEFPR